MIFIYQILSIFTLKYYLAELINPLWGNKFYIFLPILLIVLISLFFIRKKLRRHKILKDYNRTNFPPRISTSSKIHLLNIDFLGLFNAIFVSGKDLAESTLSDLAFKLDVPLMNWFIDKAILPNDSVQLFMQGFIVIAEILIGLALIGGLFTTPAAAMSLVLQFMFVCTTGLYLGTFWMVFAGIAVLIGAGRTLGLDYYAMPWLKKQWKKLPIVRKLYIYND